VRWLSLRELYGRMNRWPNGQASYLYAYERPGDGGSQGGGGAAGGTYTIDSMAEHAISPADVVQGNVRPLRL